MIEGKLDLIDNQIVQTTGTIRLRASFPNSKRQLWPGELVNARLLVETRHDGLTIPARPCSKDRTAHSSG